MRPYRAIPVGGKDFVYGWYVFVNSTHYIIKDGANARSDYKIVWIDSKATTWIEVIPETVGQQIGIKDKNGVEIYEGDKVHIWSTFYKKDMPEAEVFWNEKAAKFDIKPSDGQYHHWLAMGHHKGWFVEVIGNIHQEADNG